LKNYITGDDISILYKYLVLLKIDFVQFNPFDNIKPSPAIDNYCFENSIHSPAAGIAYDWLENANDYSLIHANLYVIK
jgi:hypothetical protein